MERVEISADTPPVNPDGTPAPVPQDGASPNPGDGGQPGARKYAGKYLTVEELEKGYLEAQKALSSRKPAEPPSLKLDEGNPNPNPTPAAAGQPTLDALIEGASQEFAATGTLTPASRKKLTDAGITDTIIDRYMAGQKAEGERVQTEVFNLVGGSEQYAQLQAWAAQSLNQADKDAFNEALASNNLALIKMAVSGLHQRFTKETGSTPSTRVNGAAEAGPSSGGYESWAQVTADMRDPRYENDPAFRQAVERKLKNSRQLA